MSKINILYYEPTSGFGGSSRCLLDWSRKIDRSRFDFIVVAHENGPAIKKMAGKGIRVIHFSLKKFIPEDVAPPFSYIGLVLNSLFFYLPTLIFLLFVAKTNKINIFHLNAKIKSVIPGILAAKLLHLPCICHIHDFNKPIKREIIFGKLANCLAVLTPRALEYYKRSFPGQRLELVPNGVSLEDYSFQVDVQKKRFSLGINSDMKIIGIIGRLVEGKGFSDFIRAAKIINSKLAHVRFLIIGSAPRGSEGYESSLRRLSLELGLEAVVIFTGWREDAKELMSICDILVQASSTFPEGFPLVCLEALALGKPLIVTDVPGSSEAVVDGVSGIVIPPSNPSKMAEAMEKLLLDEDLIRAMGRKARDRVQEQFKLDDTVARLQTIYSSLLP